MSLKKEYKIFVEEMIMHGDEEKAVLKAYPHLAGDGKTIRTYCGRLLKNVEIQRQIKEQSDKIEAIATQKAAEELKGTLIGNTLTAMRKRQILHEIAEGSLKIPVRKRIWDEEKKEFSLQEVMEIPDHTTRMKAIDLDNKMAGDYAPEKKDLNLNGSFLDFLMSTD